MPLCTTCDIKNPLQRLSILLVDNEHANQSLQCSCTIPTYTLVVHSVALYWLGGAQEDFACSLSAPSMMVHNTMLSVSLSVCPVWCLSIIKHSHGCTIWNLVRKIEGSRERIESQPPLLRLHIYHENVNLLQFIMIVSERHEVLGYIEDAVVQLLEHREENPKVNPTKFFSD